MDVKEYISSGIVELYAMNALSPEEKKDFEKMGLIYPEIVQELRKVEASLESYAKTHSINPGPGVREKLLSELHKIAEQKPAKPEVKKPEPEDHSITYKYLIAASLAALVVSTFASWFFYSKWGEAEEKYTALLKEKNELTVNFNVVKATYDELLASMLIIRDELSTVYTLMPVDTSHAYQARVYWNKFNKHTYIDILSLPEPTAGMQYQLWAITEEGPADAGLIDEGLQRVHRAKDVELAEKWMLTLEPAGGSTVPSPDKKVLESR